MSPSLSESKVTPNFCFAFKIPDDVTASTMYSVHWLPVALHPEASGTAIADGEINCRNGVRVMSRNLFFFFEIDLL